MRFVFSRVRRGAATLAVGALLCFPMAAFADAAEIQPPVAAPAVAMAVTQPLSLWEMFLVWVQIAAEIQPPVG